MIFNENKPYIFFSYPHRNNNASRVIQVLRNDGYNVWNDEGIKHASLYDDVIASHVEGCKVFLAYITREYLESDYCISEIKYALEKNKPIVIVLEHEKDLKLVEKYQNGLYMRISKIQALIHDRFATEDSFNRAICSTEAFNKCKINQNEIS